MSFAHLAAFAAMALVLALPAGARPDPLSPRAEVPPPRTPAALRGYRPATTPEPGQWREANDNVARIGGWKTYLREAQQADAATAAASVAPAASAPRPAGPHHGHR